MARVRNAVIAALLAAHLPCYSQAQLAGRVSAVADGDTITVKTDNNRRIRIRLQGIDAPERTMPYSQISRRHLAELAKGKVVTFDPEKLDRYGRTVATVRLQDGTDVCLEQIKAGLAWHFKRYEQSPQERAAYAKAREHSVKCATCWLTATTSGRRGTWCLA